MICTWPFQMASENDPTFKWPTHKPKTKSNDRVYGRSNAADSASQSSGELSWFEMYNPAFFCGCLPSLRMEADESFSYQHRFGRHRFEGRLKFVTCGDDGCKAQLVRRGGSEACEQLPGFGFKPPRTHDTSSDQAPVRTFSRINLSMTAAASRTPCLASS